MFVLKICYPDSGMGVARGCDPSVGLLISKKLGFVNMDLTWI